MRESKIKTECDRCGTCCTKGGPALHLVDMELLLNKWLKQEHLITIRKGEPVFFPAADNPEPAGSELIKLKGRSLEWTCLFFNTTEAACEIYEHRPLECSLLKCWETADLEKAAGRDLLNRYDIIADHDPVLAFIKTHDEKCSLLNLARILSEVNRQGRKTALSELTSLVNTDMAIRVQACTKLQLSLDLELFFFGRPLFKILNQYGIETYEENGVFRLSAPLSQATAKQGRP